MQQTLFWRSWLEKNLKLRTFLVIWLGQSVSVFGSGLTSFALGLWVYQRTGSVTAFSLMGLAAVLPQVLLSPLAGLAADRFNRRWLMVLSDLGAGLGTLAVTLLMWTGRMEIWHLYLITTVSAICGAFQWPAYSAATTQLVPSEELGRMNGLVSVSRAAAGVLAPSAAGLLVSWIGVPGVLLVDFCTFLIAMVTLFSVRFPPLRQSLTNAEEHQRRTPSSFLHDVLFGWRYIWSQPGLFGLLIFLMIFNFIWSMVSSLAAPLILNFGSAQDLGLFITVAGSGMLVGSLVMSAWGGPKRKILGVVIFELLSGFCFILMGLRPEFWLVAVGAFGAHFTIAIIDGSNKSIWQRKVPEAAQGRVFAIWQMVALAASPLAYLSAGPLADRVFEPLMRGISPASTALGFLVGTGAGRGIGLMFVLMGILKIISAIGCIIPKSIRLV